MPSYKVSLVGDGLLAFVGDTHYTGTITFTMELEADDVAAAVELADELFDQVISGGPGWDWTSQKADEIVE